MSSKSRDIKIPKSKDKDKDNDKDNDTKKMNTKITKKSSKTKNEEEVILHEKDDIDKMLEEADEVASLPVIEPSEQEKKALVTYCDKSLKCKAKELETRNSVKAMKVEVNDIRKALYQSMKLSGKDCLVLPKSLLRQAEEEAENLKHMPPPPYLRIKTNNQDLSITDEVLSEAIDQISAEDVEEQEITSGRAALIKAIVDVVRRNIREFKEQFVMTSSIPRGTRAVDIDDADEASATMAIEMCRLQNEIAKIEKGSKEDITELKQIMKAVQPHVDAFFVRGNFSSQRVQLGELPFNLMRRETQSKPKLNFKSLLNLVESGVADAFHHTKTKADSKEAAVNILSKPQARDDLKRLILSKFAAIPSVKKVSIHLKSLKEQQDEGDGEEDEDLEQELEENA